MPNEKLNRLSRRLVESRDVQPQGHRSGLDADTLDGKHASELAGGGGSDPDAIHYNVKDEFAKAPAAPSISTKQRFLIEHWDAATLDYPKRYVTLFNIQGFFDTRYSQISHDHDTRYVNIAGDAMSGDLAMTGNDIVNVGRLGIGTLSPDAPLEVKVGAADPVGVGNALLILSRPGPLAAGALRRCRTRDGLGPLR